MYEFHGWIVIRETPKNIDENNIDYIHESIGQLIKKIEFNSGVLKMVPVNGEYRVIISGLINRRTKEADEILQLYNNIAKKAPGSYGLLYIRDDGSNEGYGNEFIVYVLKRGEIKICKDTFLSPFVPVVEDEY